MNLCDKVKSFLIDPLKSMKFSFSRLKSFYNCKYEWKLKYIDKEKGEGNFFTQYGTLIHDILEKICNEELSVFEIISYYTEHFKNDVTYAAPYNKYSDIRSSYFQKGLSFLENIIMYVNNKYKIIGAELEIDFIVDGINFVGYIDLLLEEIETGDIVVVDHKSTSISFKRNGEVSKKNIDNIDSFKKQLYLYSLGILKKYGKLPSRYIVNLFNMRDSYKFEFNLDEFERSITWAKDTLNLIRKEELFAPSNDDYYCRYLCEFRNAVCKYKK